MSALTVIVDCYAGHRGEETPSSFALEDRVIRVVEILDRWLAPDHRYFKVKGDDGDTYILRHEVQTQAWELTMFKSAGSRQ